MKEEVFSVRPEHLLLFQRMNVAWDSSEYGSPAIDSKRPYGNSDVIRDIAEILEWDKSFLYEDEDEWGYSDDAEVSAWEIHKEMRIVLQILIDNLSIKKGIYHRKRYGGKWIYQGEQNGKV